MSISRRNMLRTLGIGAVANVAFPAFASPRLPEFAVTPSAKPSAGPIRLNRNENAYGASPLAIAALREGLTDIYRYPELGDALQEKLAERVEELQAALSNVKQLRGLLPICSYCKRIRGDDSYWQQVEGYISAHSNAQFSHGICPTCYATISAELDQMSNDRADVE